jgi:hypothetical protein
MVLFLQFRANLILDTVINFLGRAKAFHFPGGKIIAVPPQTIGTTMGLKVSDRIEEIPAKRPLKQEVV